MCENIRLALCEKFMHNGINGIATRKICPVYGFLNSGTLQYFYPKYATCFQPDQFFNPSIWTHIQRSLNRFHGKSYRKAGGFWKPNKTLEIKNHVVIELSLQLLCTTNITITTLNVFLLSLINLNVSFCYSLKFLLQNIWTMPASDKLWGRWIQCNTCKCKY